jgi:farnesyl diphosphate synthase
VAASTTTEPDYLDRTRRLIETALSARLPTESELAPELIAAMRHAVLGGGKRLRPLLVCATTESLLGRCGDVDAVGKAMDPACAIEFIHAYSLIHDDLPAMDDDALRHGSPACHVAFGEATAILAGDALQALAFAVLAQARGVLPEQRLRMVSIVAEACGWEGMVGGQARDIAATGKQLGADVLTRMHDAKTGALLRASVQLGALAAAADTVAFEHLTRFSTRIGVAFQIVDDVLDVIATTETLGKTAGADARAGKASYAALMGVDASRTRAEALLAAARQDLLHIGLEQSPLADVATCLVNRDR